MIECSRFAMRLLILCILFYHVAAELSDQLRYFETLHHLDINVRKKRSVDGHDSDTQDFSFTAFGKSFNMVLKPGSPVISADFRAKLVYRDGQTVPLYINENDFFTGHLSENENIKVDAHTEGGIWTANIYDINDIYTLEPSRNHIPPSDNHSMIVYRHSDIKWNSIFPDLNKTSSERRKFCRGIHPQVEPDYDPELEYEQEMREVDTEQGSARFRRGAPEKNTCHIIAVADFTFFSGPGGGFPHRTANSIIQTMQKVNRIYRDTVWNELGLTGMGLQIKELRIHPELTDQSNYHRNGKHYNMYDSGVSWPYGDFLEQFGEDNDIGKFCLAHLFTHRTFSGGVLGLAYIASPRKYAIGGICSTRRSGERTYNIGFSTSMNTKGNNLLTQEAMLVTAHEFGHNWGAEHDAETSECAPDAFNKGRYIMYPFAVSGYDENNFIFSPCSKRYISATLSARSESCFKAEESKDDSLISNVPLCGNGIIDKEEDCDGGGMGLNGLDPCCSASCKFIGNATCSPINYECCKSCQMAPKDTLCRGTSRELCQEAAVCSGFSLDCPPSKALKDDTTCIDEGKCFTGECLDYCAFAGRLRNVLLRPCRCEDLESSCLRCCKSLNESCKPLHSPEGDSFLQDGRPCTNGYCEAGKCQRTSANMIQRLFDFIEHLDSSTFVAFMRSNIVGTVIIFSLVVWIPLSWTISCFDKRNERKEKEQEPAGLTDEALVNLSVQNNFLPRNLQGFHIKTSRFRRTGSPEYQGSSGPTGASSQPPDPAVVKKYKFYHKPDSPANVETGV